MKRKGRKMKVGCRMKWHRSQDENDKCMCMCVCAAAGVTPNKSPQWPMINLQSNWLDVRKRWLIIGLLLTTLWMCVCMQTSVWKAAVFANALPLHPHHPAPCARVPPRKGNKRGADAFRWLPSCPLRRLIGVCAWWDGCIKKEKQKSNTK